MATLLKTSGAERGQAVIEMALTLPLLLIVVFGIIDFGFMFQRYESVTNAAREGARLGSLPSYNAAEAKERARQYMVAAGINATAGNERPPVNGTCGGGEVKNTWCAMLTPPTPVTVTGSTPPKTVNQVTMIVEYDHEHAFVGPLMKLFGGTGWTTIRLRSVSSMRRE